MPTIRQFEIIQALATHRHFGRAASALGIFAAVADAKPQGA